MQIRVCMLYMHAHGRGHARAVHAFTDCHRDPQPKTSLDYFNDESPVNERQIETNGRPKHLHHTLIAADKQRYEEFDDLSAADKQRYEDQASLSLKQYQKVSRRTLCLCAPTHFAPPFHISDATCYVPLSVPHALCLILRFVPHYARALYRRVLPSGNSSGWRNHYIGSRGGNRPRPRTTFSWQRGRR